MKEADAAIKEAIERLNVATMQHYNSTRLNRTKDGAARFSRVCDMIATARSEIREGIE